MFWVISDCDLADFLEWNYWCAMRPGETARIVWSDVDLADETVTPPAFSAKIERPRTIPLEGPLHETMARRQARRIVGRDLVLHRRHRGRAGQPIKDYRTAWATACEAVGLVGGRAGATPCDLRRSRLRHLVRSGKPITTVIAISGHITNSTFRTWRTPAGPSLAWLNG